MSDSSQKRPYLLRILGTWGIFLFLVVLLSVRLGPIPPIGAFLSPVTGYLRNAPSVVQRPAPITIATTGLKGKISISVDMRGVPHVTAENDTDLAFGQGYATARDRLWQMELQTAATAGRVSEILGEKAFEFDKSQRQLGFLAAAEAELAFIKKNDSEQYAILEAYSRGVNSYIESLTPADWPIEYKLIGNSPELWTPLKCALFHKQMTWTLTGNFNDFKFTNALQKFSREEIDFLFPDFYAQGSPILDLSVANMSLVSNDLLDSPALPIRLDGVLKTNESTGSAQRDKAGAVSIRATSSAVIGSSAITVLPFKWVSVVPNYVQSCGLANAGGIYCWGSNSYSGVVQSTSAKPVRGEGVFVTLSVSEQHACALTKLGATYCWGFNGSGELGDGTTTNNAVPQLVAGGLTFVSLTGGGHHSCGLTSAGVAYCWGDNTFGQLGDGSTTSQHAPVPVRGSLTFTALSTGSYHTCGTIASGAMYCWGDNTTGKLGDGTTTQRSTPTLVSGGIAFNAVAAGGSHSCGRATSGGWYCWGSNAQGQLGDGTTTQRLTPVSVSGSRTLANLSAGDTHTCALTSGGSASCWGAAYANGGTSDLSTPAVVTGSGPFVSIVAGHSVTCASASDGSAYCWGLNSVGQLGTGNPVTPNASPLPVVRP